MTTCTVYVRDARDGRLTAGHVTAAATLFGACRQALAWFESNHGRVRVFPDDTVLEVSCVGNPEKTYYVRAGDVRRAVPLRVAPEAGQQDLFAPDARLALDPE